MTLTIWHDTSYQHISISAYQQLNATKFEFWNNKKAGVSSIQQDCSPCVSLPVGVARDAAVCETMKRDHNGRISSGPMRGCTSWIHSGRQGWSSIWWPQLVAVGNHWDGLDSNQQTGGVWHHNLHVYIINYMYYLYIYMYLHTRQRYTLILVWVLQCVPVPWREPESQHPKISSSVSICAASHIFSPLF